MNKVTVVVIIMVLLTVFAMAVPAFAESPKKIPVKVEIRGKTEVSSVIDVNPGGIQHVNLVWEGPIRLYIPETSTSYLSGIYRDEITGMRIYDSEHANANEGVFHFREVWTFDEGNTFEGIATVRTHAPGFSKYEAHIVLQGSGIFKGQTLSLYSEFPPVSPDRGPTYHGELLIP